MNEDNKELATLDMNSLALDAATAEFYKENARVGMQDLGGSLPQLKVNEANSKNLLADGSRPPAGTFYYSPTKELVKDPEVSIVAVSRGFYTLQKEKDGTMPLKKDGSIDTRFNQLVGGFILETMQPFVVFASGTRWTRFNDFVKSIRPFTRNRKSPVPMMAFRVQLSLKEIETSFGFNHVIVYTLVRNEHNQLQVITDLTTLEVMREGADLFEEMFTGFINRFEVDKETGERLNGSGYSDDVTTISEPANGEVADEELPASDLVTDVDDISDDVPF